MMYGINRYLKLKKIKCLSIFILILTLISCSSIDDRENWSNTFMNYSNLHKYSTGENQTIALIDSGVSEAYIDNAYKNFSVVGNDLLDTNGHGTIMYSLLKGYEEYLTGISPDSDIISIKVATESGKITPDSIKRALEIALEHDEVDIINLSVGSYKYNKEIEDLIKKAISDDIIVVVSSGDYKDIEMMFPANVEGVISVGAIGENGKTLGLTSGADKTTINAPGESIQGLGLENEIIKSNGTSQAATLISGYISLISSYADEIDVELSIDEIEEYLNAINKKELTYEDVFKQID